MTYAITATVERAKPGEPDWVQLRQVPTFYLDERVQGIVSEEHAASIAEDIINPFGDLDTHITAVKL